jgi:PAS domain S-box-containing protein
MSHSDRSPAYAKAEALVRADAAFAALEASGAPILAFCDAPLRRVYSNEASRSAFGEAGNVDAPPPSPGFASERRLADVFDSVRSCAAPRLERLRLLIRRRPQTVTLLCRRLTDDSGFVCYAIAALGVRGDAPALLEPALFDTPMAESSPSPPVSTQSQAPQPGAASPGDLVASLRALLAERHGGRAPRFLWKTDADGRFVDLTHVLADVVGEANADLLGADFASAARRLGLDDAVVQAFRDLLDAPNGVRALAPVTLGGLPSFDGARRFEGFQGYGVLHLVAATPAPPRPAPAPATQSETPLADAPVVETPRAEAPVAPEPSAPVVAASASAVSDNVVPLRPFAPRDGEAAAERAPPGEALTATERTACDEISRALGPVIEGSPRDLMERIEQSVSAEGDSLAQDALASAPPRHIVSLLDRLPVGVLVARGDAALYANRTLLDTLGYDDLGALSRGGGLARIFFCAPFTAAALADVARRVDLRAQDGETLNVDAHVQTIDWDGGPATLIALRRKIATAETLAARDKSRTTETALLLAREEAEGFRAALEASGDAVAILTSDGRIAAVNAAFAALIGAEKAALPGQDLRSFVDEEEARIVNDRLARARLAERAAADAPARITLRAQGGGAQVAFSVRRLGGAPESAFCAVLRDLAPVQRSQAELEAARHEAERASAAKSEFLARISHEIRTPLSAILGFAEVMMEERFGPVGSERYKDYLKDVHASGSHVLSLVNDLLDLSKIEAGKMELAFERVDVNAVISECVSMMQAQANQGRVIMRLSLAPRLPSVRADLRALRQILLNLLSNAVKFNEAGGQVIVSSAQIEGGAVVIRVKDTGVGMNEADIATALEPFARVESTRQTTGTGLGLPLTKALIEANHASFTIKSRKDEGTLVEVAFPPPQVMAAE